MSIPNRSCAKLKLPEWSRAHPVFNKLALKLYVEDTDLRSPSPPPPPALIDSDAHERYIVERVLSHRTYRAKLQYLVKWQGYQEPTWEPDSYQLDESR